MTNVKLVIFDCDGVLVDSEPPMLALLMRYFTDRGMRMDPTLAHSVFVGGTLSTDGEEAERRGAVLTRDWLPEFRAMMFAELRKGVPLIEGVVPLIDAIDAAGMDRAIVSNGAMEKMDITLTPSGLLSRFEGRIFSGYVHAAPKPAPDLVLAAMAHAGVAPDQTVMIDDSPAGCRAGVAAGVRTFGYATEGQDDALRAVGAEVVGRMAQIQQALGL